ncbi:hypothetical protein FAES_0709 [Fibrella aestuarina BUZ 2]|uniref:Uncharacterized protein n=1 Tax=Fibrella aestuarina BUZ 2 TaxID=1166018 RepID=I0K3L7_9BACT|nr:hypothetical protein FAES_0709 [Fibrella aestuarina BUZ 2]
MRVDASISLHDPHFFGDSSYMKVIRAPFLTDGGMRAIHRVIDVAVFILLPALAIAEHKHRFPITKTAKLPL